MGLPGQKKLLTRPLSEELIVFEGFPPDHGDAFEKKCPICGWHGKSFAPTFSNHSLYPNDKCPSCASSPRHRLIWLYLKKKTDIFRRNKKFSILHIAPELSFSARLKKIPNATYVSLDRSHPRAIIKANVERLLFKNSSFDIILAIHVLNYVKNDTRAVKELFRVLKPGGWAIIQSKVKENSKTTITRSAMKKQRHRDNGFCYFLLDPNCLRVYGQDYGKKFEEAGFSVKNDKYASRLMPVTLARFGLCRDGIYVFRKPIE